MRIPVCPVPRDGVISYTEQFRVWEAVVCGGRVGVSEGESCDAEGDAVNIGGCVGGCEIQLVLEGLGDGDGCCGAKRFTVLGL